MDRADTVARFVETPGVSKQVGRRVPCRTGSRWQCGRYCRQTVTREPQCAPVRFAAPLAQLTALRV